MMSPRHSKFALSNAKKKQSRESACAVFGLAEWSFSGVQIAFQPLSRRSKFEA
jgi:hypothetical protein